MRNPLPPNVRLYHQLRRRCVRRNLDFTIAPEDIVIPEHCPVLGHVLIANDANWSPAIDRIDNSRGYVRGNVCVISRRANRLKSDHTEDTLLRVLAYIRNPPTPTPHGEHGTLKRNMTPTKRKRGVTKGMSPEQRKAYLRECGLRSRSKVLERAQNGSRNFEPPSDV